jgi:hypothetical protein
MDEPTDASADAPIQPQDAAEAGSDGAVPLRQPALSELLERYRAWSPQPAMPQSISAEIFSLCRLPTSLEQSFADSEHGQGRYLQDWLNDSARSMFESKRTPFAVGAAIVKEKLASDSTGKLVLAARGLMIKREPGFDPAHGDWEFGYWEPAVGLSSGPESARACGGCHAGAGTDFVFLDQTWRRM